MTDNWWESAPLVGPAKADSFTGYIPGVKKPEKPDDPPSGYRWSNGPGSSLVAIPGGPADKPAGDEKTTAEAKAAAGYYARALNAHQLYAQGVEPRSAGAQMVADVLPSGVVNTLSSPERRAATNFADEFIRAKLRKESGAAIPTEEMAREYQVYFPVPGDGPEDLKRKAALREQAIEGLRVAAGPAAAEVKILPTSANVGDAGGDVKFNDEDQGVTGRRLTADQMGEYAAFLATKPDAASLNKWWEAKGFPGLHNAEEVAKALREGKPVDSGVDYSKVDEGAEAAARAELGKQNVNSLNSDTPTEVLVRSGATLNIADEAAGVGRGLSFALQGKNPVEGYKLGRDAERLRIADARQQLGYGGTALEIAGGLASANPTAVLAPATSALATIKQGARAGAYGGALAGFGAGEGAQDTVNKTLMGGAAGGVLGGTISAISTRYAPKGMNPELANAADAEGVDLIRPMVDETTISDYGALESNIYSQPIIRGAAARVRGQIEDRTDALGRGGRALDELSLGDTVQAAARRDHATLKATRTRLYERASKSALADGNPDIVPTKAIAAVDADIAELQRIPNQNANEIALLEGLKADLSRPGLKLQDIRDMRTGLRKRITGDLLGTKAEARASEILNVARDDIEAAVSPKTANAFRRADMFEAQRRDYVRNTLEKFMGSDKKPVAPGTALQRLKAMASPRGDGKRLAAFYRRLDPAEANDVAASFAQMLGRRADDAPFSTAEFLRQTKNLSPSAQRTIFGPSGEQSIKNLRLLSRKLEEAEKDINRSRSATVLERQGWRLAARNFISTVAGIGGGGALASGHTATGVASLGVAAAAMGGSMIRKVLSARAMVNPRVSRWLAMSADVSSPTEAQEAVKRLGTIIAREPALAGELTPLQNELMRRLNPASADETEQ